jgi:BASS family bile acid:Na+ symporter
VAIEVGMQNAGLASGIAKEMGKIATVGLAAAVFGPVMNISGSTLASYWHKKIPKGYNEDDDLDLNVQSH